MIRHKCDDFCKFKSILKTNNYRTYLIFCICTNNYVSDEREYVLTVIGCDDNWQEYVVMVVVNKYGNIYCGKITV